MIRSLLLVALALAPAAAFAEAWSGTCSFTSNLTPTGSTSSNFSIQKKGRGCYRFVDTDTTSTSDLISIAADSALWCFDPDNAGTAATTARATIHMCTAGGTPGGTGSVNTCIDLGGANGNATLDGTEGTATTQNACIRTGPGIFFVRVTAACTKTSTNYCQVSVQGEEAAP